MILTGTHPLPGNFNLDVIYIYKTGLASRQAFINNLTYRALMSVRPVSHEGRPVRKGGKYISCMACRMWQAGYSVSTLLI